nr:protein kinase-like domain, concanavalin A-like lectin/glucanase domain protein [Tanacetum cinerariifolium]
MAHINAKSVDHVKKKELQSKGIKTLLKLLSLKYLSQASLEERNRNPSSLKCLHFINSFVIVSKESESKKEGNIKPNAAEYKDHKRVIEVKEEIKKENKEEFAEETEKETKEEEEDDLEYFDMLNYYWIMSEGLKSRRKLSSPKKIANFIGRVKGFKVFIGNFAYECEFVILEDTTSVIDHYLGGMVLGKPFVKETRLVYDKENEW